MARNDAKQRAAAPDDRRGTRLVPTQQRSRERYERILACATEVMTEKGSDAFRMSDIIERTGMSFGSLYQYFPDKTAIIATLAERCNAIGHSCVAKELAGLRTIARLHAVLCAITDSYYGFFIDVPAARDIWQAIQADRALQALDEEDGRLLTGMLIEALRPLAAPMPDATLAAFAQVVMVTMAAAVRHAIALPAADAEQFLLVFKAMLPSDLPPQI
ncbi:TetR/AcrR family transcriptional regulator [Sphingomonas lycopersici]|uniref:TetR family transcriptional regulator n=1 Tax=Sphingomonas lycopersici TaxID=2951807 RepID=A0AA42CT55_9SPHN|nr:TetR/AcrR family transcriptional regulator [Sphingomonas lycopersici]MCW6534021.1 TetR family transcriptional regulator [Sphingomonas lycopersici]